MARYNDQKEHEGTDAHGDAGSPEHGSARDAEQSRYDREFEDITRNYDQTAPEPGRQESTAAGSSATPSAEELRRQEENPLVSPAGGTKDDPGAQNKGFFNPVDRSLDDKKSGTKKGKEGDAGGDKATGEDGAADLAAGAAGAAASGLGPINKQLVSRLAKVVLRNKRKGLFGGATIGSIIVIILILMGSILPLKINHIMENVQKYAFSSASDAVGKETNNLLSDYIARHVIPGIKAGTCKNTRISKSCVSRVDGDTPVAKLYRGWAQGKVENRLANEFGVEFGKERNRIYMKAPGLAPDGIDVSDLGSTAHPTIFDYPEVSRSDARLAIKNATADMTLWQRAMFRYKVGRLAQEKYGIRRCIIYCNLVDKFDAWVEAKKAALPSNLIERVIEPRAANLASALKCMSTPECHPQDKTTDPANASDATNGEPQSDFDRELQVDLNTSAATSVPRSWTIWLRSIKNYRPSTRATSAAILQRKYF